MKNWVIEEAEARFFFRFGSESFTVADNCDFLIKEGAEGIDPNTDPAMREYILRDLGELREMRNEPGNAKASGSLSPETLAILEVIDGLEVAAADQTKFTLDLCKALRRQFGQLSEFVGGGKLAYGASDPASEPGATSDAARFFRIGEKIYMITKGSLPAAELPAWLEAVGADLAALKAPAPVVDNFHSISAWLLSLPWGTPRKDWPEDAKSKLREGMLIDDSWKTWADETPERGFFYWLGGEVSASSYRCSNLIDNGGLDPDDEEYFLEFLESFFDLLNSAEYAKARAMLSPEALAILKAIDDIKAAVAQDTPTLDHCKALRDRCDQLSKLARAGSLTVRGTISLQSGEAPKKVAEGSKPGISVESAEGGTTKKMTPEETFIWFDGNGDGFVIREEIMANPPSKRIPPQAMPKIADNLMKDDKDGDGKISRKEWMEKSGKASEAPAVATATVSEDEATRLFRIGEMIESLFEHSLIRALGKELPARLDDGASDLVAVNAPGPVIENFQTIRTYVQSLPWETPWEQWTEEEKKKWREVNPMDGSWETWRSEKPETNFFYWLGTYSIRGSTKGGFVIGDEALLADNQKALRDTVGSFSDLYSSVSYADSRSRLSPEALATLRAIYQPDQATDQDKLTLDHCKVFVEQCDRLKQLARSGTLTTRPSVLVDRGDEGSRLFRIGGMIESLHQERLIRAFGKGLPSRLDGLASDLAAVKAPGPVVENFQSARTYVLSLPWETPWDQWPEEAKKKWREVDPVDGSWETWRNEKPESRFFYWLGVYSVRGSNYGSSVVGDSDLLPGNLESLLAILKNVDALSSDQYYAGPRSRLTKEAHAVLKAIHEINTAVAGDKLTLDRCLSLRDQCEQLLRLSRSGSLTMNTDASVESPPTKAQADDTGTRLFRIGEMIQTLGYYNRLHNLADVLPARLEGVAADLAAVNAPGLVADNFQSMRPHFLKLPWGTPFDQWTEEAKKKFRTENPMDDSWQGWVTENAETEFFFLLGWDSILASTKCSHLIQNGSEDLDPNLEKAVLEALDVLGSLFGKEGLAEFRARLTPEALAILTAIHDLDTAIDQDKLTLDRCKALREHCDQLSELARAGRLTRKPTVSAISPLGWIPAGSSDELLNQMNRALELRTHGKDVEAKDLYRSVEQQLRSVLDLREKELGPEHPDTLAVRLNLANSLFKQEKKAEAIKETRAALAGFNRILDSEHPSVLMCRNNLGFILDHSGESAEAEQILRGVLAIRERLLGPEHFLTLQSRFNLALSFYTQDKYREAEPYFRTELMLREKLLGPEHRNTIDACYYLGACVKMQEKHILAMELMARAEAGYSKTLGADSVDANLAAEFGAESAAIVKKEGKLERMNETVERGKVLYEQGNYPEAVKFLNLARAFWELELGPEHPQTLNARHNVAVTQSKQEKYAEAENEFRELMVIRERIFGAEHAQTLTELIGSGPALNHLKRLDEAEREHRAVLEIRGRTLGPEHPDTLGSRNNLGGSLLAQGRNAEAEKEFRTMLQLREKVLGPEHPDVFISCSNLARCLGIQKSYKEAMEFVRRGEEGLIRVLGPEHPETKIAQKAREEIEAAMK